MITSEATTVQHPSALYTGQVYHKRKRPAVHVLRYRVFSLLLNLDEIDGVATRLWLFSRNRWNLFSFYDKDFGELYCDQRGEQHDESLKDYVARNLKQAGIDQTPHTTLLSCYPRVCGYTFNPLSLFYCLDENNNLFAVLHEVHNTFNERHVYVLSVDSGQGALEHTETSLNDMAPIEPSANESLASGSRENKRTKVKSIEWIEQRAQKELFVSPFAHMNMNYRFRLNMPAQKQVIVIHVDDEAGHFLTASYTAQRHTLTASRLLRCFLRFPAMTLKVTVGIHWEALRLFLKKVPWFSHQAKATMSSNNIKNS